MVREIEPWSLTKSDLTNFSPFQTISGRKWLLAKMLPPHPPLTKGGSWNQQVFWPISSPFQGGGHGAKRVMGPIFTPFQTISPQKIVAKIVLTPPKKVFMSTFFRCHYHCLPQLCSAPKSLKSKVLLTHWLTDWLTMSPIELSWTANNWTQTSAQPIYQKEF